MGISRNHNYYIFHIFDSNTYLFNNSRNAVLLLISSLLEWETSSVQFHLALLHKFEKQDKGCSITNGVFPTYIFRNWRNIHKFHYEPVSTLWVGLGSELSLSPDLHISHANNLIGYHFYLIDVIDTSDHLSRCFWSVWMLPLSPV